MLQEIDKKIVLNQLISTIDEKMQQANLQAKDLADSLQNESKSTAGDKHDTGRAMIHLEQEKLQHQFQELRNQMQQIKTISHLENSNHIVEYGSFIKAGDFYFLLGVGIGKQIVNGILVYCIGMETPIGKILNGRKKGDQFTFTNQDLIIEEIS